MRWQTYKYDKEKWHPWFAWCPKKVVRDIDGNKVLYDWYWLQTLECRKITYSLGSYWTYRTPLSDKPETL